MAGGCGVAGSEWKYWWQQPKVGGQCSRKYNCKNYINFIQLAFGMDNETGGICSFVKKKQKQNQNDTEID